MNKKFKLFASAVLLSQSFAVSANITDCIHPYVGADVTWRYQSIRKDFGGNVIKRSFPQGGLYAGLKFNDYFGVEAGYESTTEQRRTTVIADESTLIFGGLTSPGVDSFNTSTRIYGWHADLIGTYPICICNENINLLGYVGIAHKTVSLKYYPTIIGSTTLPPEIISELTQQVRVRKSFARLGLGIQYMLNDCAGIRLLAGWENLSQFKNQQIGDDAFLRLKDAVTATFGIFYSF